MKKRVQSLSALAMGAMLLSSASVFASGDHEHGHDEHKMSSGMKHEAHGSGHGHHDGGEGHKGHGAKHDMFLVKKNIDGYTVSFHVMKAKPGKEMGGTHNFMIKVEKDGKAIKNIVMNTKVKYPNGKSEMKKTMKMGDWLMAGYDLGDKGKHQLMILFKTADGSKHKGGVYYPGS